MVASNKTRTAAGAWYWPTTGSCPCFVPGQGRASSNAKPHLLPDVGSPQLHLHPLEGAGGLWRQLPRRQLPLHHYLHLSKQHSRHWTADSRDAQQADASQCNMVLTLKARRSAQAVLSAY